MNKCYYAPGIAKRTKPSSVQKVQKVQKGWRGGLQSDRQSHRLVITRSRLTKPHDPVVSHEPRRSYPGCFRDLRSGHMQKMVHALNRFAPLVMRAHLALPHPCGVRPWLLPRHHNNEISFLFLFAFPFLLFCLPPNVFLFLFASQCQSPMSESQRQLSQSKPAAGNKCKSKVYNVCSDVEWMARMSGQRCGLLAAPDGPAVASRNRSNEYQQQK